MVVTPIVFTTGWTLIAAAVLLIGMPLFVVLVLALLTGYISHDAEQYLEELSDEEIAALEAAATDESDEDPPEAENSG